MSALAPGDTDRYRRLIEATRGGEPVVTAVIHPCSVSSLTAAVEAAAERLIAPILVGPAGKVRAAADLAGIDLAGFPVEDVPHSHAAAARGVALIREGTASLLMKGSLHTDELLGAVLARETGLRTERRISHAYVMDVPGYPTPLIITDAAINIAPDLMAKADIVRNAIDLAHVIGIAEPRIAILSAVETVNPVMQSTIDAAALCKMADRGQIEGGLLDGPLAFLGNADAAGVVLGARVPVILTSRADSSRTRQASCAVAVLLTRAAPKAAPGLLLRP